MSGINGTMGKNGAIIVTPVVLYGLVQKCRVVRETWRMAPHVLGFDGLNSLILEQEQRGKGEHSQESDCNLVAWQESLDSFSKL